MTIITLPNNNQDRTFTARRINKGDRYGLNNVLVHDQDEPLVALTDITDPNKPQGLPPYYLQTLKEGKTPRSGLMFFGHAPDWSVSAENMQRVVTELS